ncbi:MAG: hypothetical protein K6G15_05910 [Desulfovibrio sp.]|nr:hypothetical protein [Desulfovibrio sp.]
MSQVNDVQNASSVNFSTFTGARSPQLALALLMLELADTNKKAAMDGIHDIEAQQEEKKKISDVLNQAREYKAKGLHLNDSGIPSGIDDKFVEDCKKYNITIPHYKKNADSKEDLNAKWDCAIAQLQTKMDNTGADIQTKMVQLQDMMGQYNSYTSGANTAIAKSNDILSSLARGQ